MTIIGQKNLDHRAHLIVGNFRGFPVAARALLQFEDLPSDCGTLNSATLHIYYDGFKPGTPDESRTLKVHQVVE